MKVESGIDFIGIPYALGCSLETAQVADSGNGPKSIRKSLQELRRGFDIPLLFNDGGDITCEDSVSSLLDAVQARTTKTLASKHSPFFIGGAHTFTLGALRSLGSSNADYSLIYIDAHPDIMPRDEIYYGSTLFHAIEEGVLDPKRIAYVGIRQVETPEWDQIEKHGIYFATPSDIEQKGIQALTSEILARFPAPYYMSIDLDSVDPVFAPGVSTPFPLGMNPREVLALAATFCTEELIGCELVELAPCADQNDRTSRLAAAIVLDVTTRWANAKAHSRETKK